MANIKSQIKRNKQNEKARQRNKAVKSSLKTAVRSFREAADTGDTDKANEALRAAYVKLDKAASKGVIHKNQAANRKSALAKRVATLSKAERSRLTRPLGLDLPAGRARRHDHPHGALERVPGARRPRP